MSKINVLIAVLGIGAVAAVMAVVGGAQEGEAEAGPASKPVVTAFEGAPPAGEGLPATAASELSLVGSGTEVDKSVLALTHGDWKLFLTPAASGVCLSLADVEGGASVNCASTPDLVGGPPRPLATLTDCVGGSPTEPPQCGGALLYGVVADDIESVAVRYRGELGPKTAIVNNAYMIEAALAKGPRYVEFARVDGSKVARPAGAFGGVARGDSE